MAVQRLAAVIVAFVVASCGSLKQADESSLASAATSFKPLERKTAQHQMCGIAAYNAKRDPLCGDELYYLKQNRECGVVYNQRADPACPGSVLEASTEERTTGTCKQAPADPGCPAGFRSIGYREEQTECRTGQGQNLSSESRVTAKVRYCRRDTALKTCRLKSFGEERINSCRVKSNGTERYKQCTDSSFGVATYKTCSFYLDASGIRQFIDSRTDMAAYMSENLVKESGQFYSHVGDERGSACVIAKYGSDPLYDEIVAELKTLFMTRFGVEYRSDLHNCTAGAPAVNIDTHVCASTDDSRACRSWRSYNGAKTWLTVTRTDIDNLLNDVVAKTDALVQADLKKLKTKLAGGTP